MLERKILELKLASIEKLSSIYESIARLLFNYPDNPGMKLINPISEERRSINSLIRGLPMHPRGFPVVPNPKSLLEAFIGNFPHTVTIEKVFYEHKTDGYYNFYVQNYRNIFFLPDWLSQWIQLNFDMSVDIRLLEYFRESVFITALFFMAILQIRIQLYWFLSINPYTRPWVYIISIVDWIFDVSAGFAPVFLGLDLSSAILTGLLGKFLDSLNHLVFTMPFLPSEGERGKMIINGQLKEVILFRFLPSLWYSHPIPEELREYWYTERPEILKYMQKNYNKLDIEFLPTRVLKEMYEQKHRMKLDTMPTVEASVNHINHLSTNIIAESSNYITDISQFVNQKQFMFLHFIENSTDKWIF